MILFLCIFLCTTAGNIINNGGFEDQSALNPWFPITVGYKGYNTTFALQGNWDASFGGTETAATEVIGQNISIPFSTSPTYLQFYVSAYFSSLTILNYFAVGVDGIYLYILEASQSGLLNAYYPVAVNITEYADGNIHTIWLEGYSADNTATNDYSIVYVDEISVIYRPYTLLDYPVFVSKNGDDLTGDGTQENPFASIQRSIWSIADNQTIWILPGIYTENVDTSGKRVRMLGSGAATVMGSISCNSLVSENYKMIIDGITFLKNEVQVGLYTGLQLRNCVFANSTSEGIFGSTSANGIITARMGSYLYLQNVTFVNNTGILISAWNDNVSIWNSTFEGNSISNQNATNLNCMLYLEGKNNELNNCTFVGNYASYYSSVICTTQELLITQSTFLLNTANAHIVSDGGNITVIHSGFTHNSGTQFLLHNNASGTFEKNIISSHILGPFGSFENATVAINDCDFSASFSAFEVYKGYLEVLNSEFTTIVSVLTLGESGESLWNNCKITDITSSVFAVADNSSLTLLNHEISHCSDSVGTFESGSHIEIYNCSITNSASRSTIASFDSFLLMKNVLFTQNSAQFALIDVNFGSFSFSNITIIDNNAAVIAVRTTGTIEDSVFTGLDGIDLFYSKILFHNFNVTKSTSVNLYNPYLIAMLSGSFQFEECVIHDNYGAIIVVNSNMSMSKCTVSNSVVTDGSIFAVESTNLIVTESKFMNNRARGGGVAAIYPTSILTMKDVLCVNNSVFYGYSILEVAGIANIYDSKFYNNYAQIVAGIFFEEESSGIIENCEFNENSASAGAAIVVYTTNMITVTNSRFHNNINLGFSDAIILVDGGNLKLVDSIFTSNHRTGGGNGSALTVENFSSCSIINCSFVDNNSQYGVIYMNSSTMDVSYSTFTNNFAMWGSSLYIAESTLTITSTTFSNNVVKYDGISLGLANEIPGGGVLFVSQSILQVVDSTFSFNSAIGNGGVIWSKGGPGNISFSNCSFTGNQALNAGAVAYTSINSSLPVFNNCSFSNNTATYGLIQASDPEYLDISLPDKIFAGHQFPFNVSYIDQLGQICETAMTYTQVNIGNHPHNGYPSIGVISALENLTDKIGSKIPAFAMASPTSYIHIYGQATIEISPCEPGQEPSLLDPNVCVQCKVGTVGWGGVCVECPTSAVCPGGAAIIPKQGWWIPPRPDLIPPNSSPSLMHCDPYVCRYNTCRTHNTGVLCGNCATDYGKMRIFCTACKHANIAAVFFFCLFAITLGVALSYFPLPSTHYVGALLMFLNVICVFGQYNEYFLLLPLFQLNVDYWPWGCFAAINFTAKFAIGICVQLFVVLPISLSRISLRIQSMVSYKRQREVEVSFLGRICSNLIVLSPSLLFFSLHMFRTVTVGSTTYLAIDQQVITHSTEYTVACFFAVVALIIALIPFAAVLFLRIPNELVSHYLPQFWFWDIKHLFQIFTITITYAFLPFTPQIRTIIALFITFTSTALEFYFQPYSHKNHLKVQQITSVFTAVLAIFVNSWWISASPVAIGVLLTIGGITGTIIASFVGKKEIVEKPTLDKSTITDALLGDDSMANMSDLPS